MINPAPQRRAVLTFVSPKVSDLLFYELRDERLPSNSVPPEYGTPHWDSKKYPGHKLVHITPADESGWQKWFYAADRDGQDEYNFEFSSQGTLGSSPDTLTRTYIIPREDFTPNSIDKGTEDATYTSYVLDAEVEQRIGDATLDSLYVVIQRTYTIRGTDELRVTPLGTDILFIERHHLDEYPDGLPSYGTAHPDAATWPNHKLVFIKKTENGSLQFFYAADRANQDSYNFEFSSQGTLGNSPETLTRTYVVPRAGFVPNAIDKGTADAVYTSYVLDAEIEQRIGEQELDSLYVVLRRTYTIRGTDDVRVTPFETDVLFSERHHLDEYPGGLPSYGAAHPDADTWPDHELIFIQKSENGSLKFFYAAKRGKQNKYNFQVQEAIGASTGYDTATRTYLLKREDYLNNYSGGNYLSLILEYGGDPGADATVPAHTTFVFGNPSGAQETGPFTLTYAGRTVGRVGEQELESLYIVVVDSYIRLDTYTDSQLIPGTTKTGEVTRTLSKSPVSGGTVDDDGFVTESRQLNHDFYITTSRQVVSRASGRGGFPRTFTTSVPYFWPAVLEPGNFGILNITVDGKFRSIVDYRLRQPYQGPCAAEVTEEWYTEPPSPVTPIDPILRPDSISYNGVWVNFTIPACLHPQVFVREEYTGLAGSLWLEKTWPATPLTDWPPTITRQVVRPFQGGYLLETIVIYRPDVS